MTTNLVAGFHCRCSERSFFGENNLLLNKKYALAWRHKMNMTLRAIKSITKKDAFCLFCVCIVFVFGLEPAINLISLIDLRGARFGSMNAVRAVLFLDQVPFIVAALTFVYDKHRH